MRIAPRTAPSPAVLAAAALTLAAGSLVAGTPAAAAPPGPGSSTADRCPQLSTDLPWYGDNRAKLQRMIDERGVCSHPRLGHAGPRPVAAFDWDNTVTKNDVTDATLAWALHHDKILRPARWSGTSKWMTPAADDALTRACGTDVPVGKPLPTSTDTDCTDEIFEIREKEKTTAGGDAFAGEWNHRRTKPSYVWVPQLFAGHTPAEVRRYAREGRKEALAAPVGSTQQVGTHTIPGYVRYYPQQKDLIATLQRAGFDVYIVSAGSEPVTEVWSRGVGIDRAHTIAIRSVLERGRITTYNEGCGGVGVSQGDAMPYIDGKRCWINQDIFGIKGPKAWEKQDAAHRIALGGGDADTDVTFVNDATGVHEVLNRNKNEIMCRAYDDVDGRWVVNPMFIDPLPQKPGTYPCSTAAYNKPEGGFGPLLREDGTVVPDQVDAVHG